MQSHHFLLYFVRQKFLLYLFLQCFQGYLLIYLNVEFFQIIPFSSKFSFVLSRTLDQIQGCFCLLNDLHRNYEKGWVLIAFIELTFLHFQFFIAEILYNALFANFSIWKFANGCVNFYMTKVFY